MSLRDFRCLVSGVSLLDSEAAAWLFVVEPGGVPRPIALPIWGSYGGLGRLEEVAEGPNTTLLERAFVKGLKQGRVVAPWGELGLSPGAITDAAGILSLALLTSIHGGRSSLSWHGSPVQCALIEAHVAAALMQGEPERLHAVPVEELGPLVLPHAISRDIYRPVMQATATERCKFGLGFISCAAFIEALGGWGVELRGPGQGIELSSRSEQEWLAGALQRFSDDESLLLALSDYAAREPEQ